MSKLTTAHIARNKALFKDIIYMGKVLSLIFTFLMAMAFAVNSTPLDPGLYYDPFSPFSILEKSLGVLDKQKYCHYLNLNHYANSSIIPLRKQIIMRRQEAETNSMPDQEKQVTSPRSRIGYIEFKPGAQIFTNKTMRKIYGEINFAGKVEGGVIFYRPLTLWLDAGYYQKTGRVVNGSEKTTVKLGTATIGLKGVFFDRERLAFYIGGGPRLFVYRGETSSPFVDSRTDKIGVGGGAIAGLWFFPFSGTQGYMDIFADYSIKKFSPPSQGNSSLVFDIKLNNLLFGIGIGVAF